MTLHLYPSRILACNSHLTVDVSNITFAKQILAFICNDCGSEGSADAYRLSKRYVNCKPCTGRLPMNETNYRAKLKRVQPHIVLAGTYTSYYTDTLHKCTQCLSEWTIQPTKQIYNRSGCLWCDAGIDVRPLPIRLAEIHGDKYTLLHIRNDKTAEVRCNKCTNVWTPYISNLLSKGTGCPTCTNAEKLGRGGETMTEYSKWLTEHRPSLMLSASHSGKVYSDTITEHDCSDCGKVWKVQPYRVRAGSNCGRCANWSLTLCELQERLDALYGDIQLQEDLGGRRQRYRHISCGKTWDAYFTNVMKGGGCPHCRTTRHGSSNIAHEWLEALEETFQIDIQRMGNPHEFCLPGTKFKVDGYCEDMNLVFEFHGSRYHGEPRVFAKQDLCHPFRNDITAGEMYKATRQKESYIRKQGYNLVTIWEMDFHANYSLETWLDFFRATLPRMVFSRLCYVAKLTPGGNFL